MKWYSDNDCAGINNTVIKYSDSDNDCAGILVYIVSGQPQEVLGKPFLFQLITYRAIYE